MRRIRRHLDVLQRKKGDLEKACVHCGACCYAKVETNGTPVLLRSLRCKFLRFDGDQSHCTVYAERASQAPWCRNLEMSIRKQILPASCPYVETMASYRGPAILDPAEVAPVEDQLRREQQGNPCPDWADPAAWQAFLEGGSP